MTVCTPMGREHEFIFVRSGTARQQDDEKDVRSPGPNGHQSDSIGVLFSNSNPTTPVVRPHFQTAEAGTGRALLRSADLSMHVHNARLLLRSHYSLA